MELFDNLASNGLTIKVLQVLIFSGIIIFLLGMFWRYIVAGVGILFCLYVFAAPNSKPAEVAKAAERQVEQTVEAEVKSIEAPPPVAEVKPKTDEDMFLEDCNLHSGYTKAQCKALWESDREDIMKSNWKYKNSKKYIQKVKHGA